MLSPVISLIHCGMLEHLQPRAPAMRIARPPFDPSGSSERKRRAQEQDRARGPVRCIAYLQMASIATV
ncbi:hypothetical protein [Aurantimonas sp. Leaf443]|uniref:hypothetical protein n=1 Tax=Aurantimonas sp. Leaf443 TaxID=1736378 RepID=UPI00138F186D|nr:hypothetical protein [Aurantimonas sp. Leaf443]